MSRFRPTFFIPLIAFLGLLALAGFGFTLGERWVPRLAMRQLGIVWLIIAMKILYGLAIELGTWELFGIFPLSESYVGVLLLILVGVNVGVAYRYDEDAIAAQAVLVLLAISSTAGSLLSRARCQRARGTCRPPSHVEVTA